MKIHIFITDGTKKIKNILSRHFFFMHLIEIELKFYIKFQISTSNVFNNGWVIQFLCNNLSYT